MQHKNRNRDGTRALAKDCDLSLVTAKGADVELNPLQSSDLILDTKVETARGFRVFALRESEGTSAVVKVDIDHGCAAHHALCHDGRAIINARSTTREATTVDVGEDGESGVGRYAGWTQHIDGQTILVNDSRGVALALYP